MNDTIGRSLPILGLLLLLNAVLPGFYHDLWNPDEPRLAHLARGMLSEGDWVVPRVNGEVFVEQPPLQAWLIALSMSAFGSGIGKDWVPRLPTMFFSLALLYLVYRVGLRYWGQGVGMIAAGLLMTTVEYYVSYQRAIVDTSLAFFVSLAMFQLVDAVASRAALSWRQAIVLGVATGCAFLAKNLIGVVFVGIVGIVLAWRYPSVFLRSPANHRLLVAAAIACSIPLPWLVAVGVVDRDLLKVLLWDNTVGRFFSTGKHNPSFFEFLHRAAGVLMPWIVVAGILYSRCLWRLRSKLFVRKIFESRNCSVAPLEVLLWWILLPTLLILVSGSKREVYLLPVAPPIALSAAIAISRQSERRPVYAVSIFLIGVSSAAVLLLALGGGIWAGTLPSSFWLYLVIHAALLYRWWLQRGWVDRQLTSSAALLLLLTTLGAGSLIFFTARNDSESYVNLCEDLVVLRDRGYQIVGVELPLREKSAIPYYLGEEIPIVKRSETAHFFREGVKPTALIFRDSLPQSLGEHTLRKYRVRRPIFVVANRVVE